MNLTEAFPDLSTEPHSAADSAALMPFTSSENLLLAFPDPAQQDGGESHGLQAVDYAPRKRNGFSHRPLARASVLSVSSVVNALVCSSMKK
jgi:hypothetical protein